MAKLTRIISFDQLSNLLDAECKKGTIDYKIFDYINVNGKLPIGYLRKCLRWVIERAGDRLQITTEV